MTVEAVPSYAAFEVVEETRPNWTAKVASTPFRIGRGGGGRNDLVLADARVSRKSVEVTFDGSGFLLADCGQRHGVFVNGKRVEAPVVLAEGDIVTFGNTAAVSLVFRTAEPRESLNRLLSRFDESVTDENVDHNLRHLNILLEATALLQAHMPYEEVLSAMVDRAITITDADRGILLEDDGEELRPLFARGRGGFSLPPGAFSPSQTAIDQALKEGQAFVQQDLSLASDSLKLADSIVMQQLRSVIAIPLYSPSEIRPGRAASSRAPLGVLYLDSRRPAAFSGLDRRILDALAIEASSVIDNARMMERERERRQMEQDLSIARVIQQRLLPKEFHSYPFMELTGVNQPCYSVGGDYFDVVELGPGKVSFVVADVAGKGLAAALLTAMLQGGFAGITLTPDPARLMNHLNRYVWGRSEPNRFASVFMGILQEGGSFEYINAGHPSPLLVHNGEVSAPFEPQSFPVGIFPDVQFFTRRHVLDRGDTLVLFTDGISEAQNLHEEEFGMERLMETVREAASASVEGLRAAILAAVASFTGEAQPADDMTLLIVRYTS